MFNELLIVRYYFKAMVKSAHYLVSHMCFWQVRIERELRDTQSSYQHSFNVGVGL